MTVFWMKPASIHPIAYARAGSAMLQNDAVQRQRAPAFCAPQAAPERRVLLLNGGDAAGTCEDTEAAGCGKFRRTGTNRLGDVDDP